MEFKVGDIVYTIQGAIFGYPAEIAHIENISTYHQADDGKAYEVIHSDGTKFPYTKEELIKISDVDILEIMYGEEDTRHG